MGVKMIIKSVKTFFFTTIIINGLIIPFIIFFITKTGNKYNVIFAVNLLTQMFTPLLASFLVCMHMSKYIDYRGNEIYYIVNKNKRNEVIKLFLSYIVCNSFPFLFYIKLNKNLGVEWIHIVIITWLFMSGSYFFCYLFRSVSLSVIPSFFYAIYSIVGFSFLGNNISYYEFEGLTIENLTSKYIYFIIVSIFIFILGSVLNDFYDKYNE